MSLTKELIKGNFKGAVKSLLSPVLIDPEKFTTPDGREGWAFEMMGNDFHYFKYDGFSSCVSAFDRCPPISAIINRKSQCFINGKTWVLNSKDKVSEAPAANRVRALLSNPNYLQSGKSFEAQMYAYMQMFGFAIILPIFPVGFTDRTNVASLWNIPASWIDINATQERFKRGGGVALTELVISFNGERVTFQLKDLIIIRDITPSLRTLTFPISKLHGLEMPINNVIGIYESANVLINYRGALGILSADPVASQFQPMPITPEHKETLQKDFRRYGLKNKQLQVIITTANLKWQQMGYTTRDLQLIEQANAFTIAICGGLNFPPFILGLADTTYNNMGAAEKGLYQNAVIPDGENIYEQLSNWFFVDLNGTLRLNKDYSHIQVLQDDAKLMAEARLARNTAMKLEWRNGMLTLDEWRKKNDEDPVLATDGRGSLLFPEYVKLYGDPDKPIQNGQGTNETVGQNQS